jgi:outer membrane protein OmpA-like peptidoglycan-associated protein
MASDVIDRAKDRVTPEMVDTVAASTGESPENTRRALHGAFPTILAGLGHRASTSEGASSLLSTLREGNYAAAAQKATGGGDKREAIESGQSLASKIFGDRSASASQALATHSGVKSSAAAQILAFAAPIVAGTLGSEVVAGGVSGLMQVLASHKKAALDHPDTPSGLAGALGAESGAPREGGSSMVDRPATTRGDATGSPVAEVPKQGAAVHKRHRWGLLLALGAVVLAAWGIFASMRGRRPERGVTAPQPTMTATAPDHPPLGPGARGANSPPSEGILLPDGRTLDVAPNTPEGDFTHTLADGAVPLPRAFHFDHLEFESGRATLFVDANRTLNDLAEILRAYPSSRIRSDGYMDDVGDDLANRALSQARANAIKNALVARGVTAERIDSASGGPRAPVAPSDSDQAEILDRRSEIVLLSR